MTPWTDRTGRLSPLKIIVFVGIFVPVALLAFDWYRNTLGPEPRVEAIHRTGTWAIRFLLITLAISPLRLIGDWPRLLLVRRMLGVAVLGYAALHLTLYIANEKYDLLKVASEIALRFYLTIGFVALLGLIALGSTSFDAAIRRMGRHWNTLHMAVYAIAALGIVHFFLQSKINVTEPTLMAGVFFLLMGYRVLRRYRIGFRLLALAGVAVAAGLLTAVAEIAWYGLATGVDPWRVFNANLAFPFVIRPAWLILALGLLIAPIPFFRQRRREKPRMPAVAAS